jgi:hypothetical protein
VACALGGLPYFPRVFDVEEQVSSQALIDFCMLPTLFCMRTTLDLDDSLIKAAKKRALEEEATLTQVLEEALRRYLAPGEKWAKPFKLKLLTKKGRVVAGVDVADRDSLYDRMERAR